MAERTGGIARVPLETHAASTTALEQAQAGNVRSAVADLHRRILAGGDVDRAVLLGAIGRILRRNGRLRWAAHFLSRARATVDAESPDLLMDEGLIAFHKNNIEVAVHSFSRAVALLESGYFPDAHARRRASAWAHYCLGKIHAMCVENFTTAIAALDRAAALDPTLVVAQHDAAFCEWKRGNHREARKRWQKLRPALQQEIVASKANWCRRVALLRLRASIEMYAFGDLAAGENDLRAALREDPENAEIMFALATMQFEKRDSDPSHAADSSAEALRWCARGTEVLERTAATAWTAQRRVLLAQLYAASDDFATAAEILAPLDRRAAHANCFLFGRIALARGDTASAVRWFRQCTVRDPWNGRAALALAQALQAQGEWAQADAVLRDYLGRRRNSPRHVGALATGHLHAASSDPQRLGAAIHEYDRALSLAEAADAPHHLTQRERARLLYGRGIAYVRVAAASRLPRGDAARRGVSDLEECVRLDPSLYVAADALERLRIANFPTRADIFIHVLAGASLIVFLLAQLWWVPFQQVQLSAANYLALTVIGMVGLLITAAFPMLAQFKFAMLELNLTRLDAEIGFAWVTSLQPIRPAGEETWHRRPAASGPTSPRAKAR